MGKSLFPDVEGIRTTLSSFSYSDTSFGSAGFHLKSALVGIGLHVTTTHRIKGQWALFWTDTLKRPIQLRLTLSIKITLEKSARSWERNTRWQEKKEDELFYFLTSSCHAWKLEYSPFHEESKFNRQRKTRRPRNISVFKRRKTQQAAGSTKKKRNHGERMFNQKTKMKKKSLRRSASQD